MKKFRYHDLEQSDRVEHDLTVLLKDYEGESDSWSV